MFALCMSKIILFLLISSSLSATELILSWEQAKAMGFKAQMLPANKSLATSLSLPHAKAWPFERPYLAGKMGNSFVQYQNYRPAGYHGGCDMVLERNSNVLAPASGRLEAGHYAYTDLENGYRIKQWIAWPGSGPEDYFELAVIDAQGFRYELHHIDRASLPASIVAKLNSGNAMVDESELLGKVVPWHTSFHYDHIHLNVMDANSNWLNPEYFFELIPDNVKPNVKVNIRYQNQRIKDFVLSVFDYKTQQKYLQAPLYYALKINSNVVYEADFRYSLVGQDGVFFDIRKLYPENIRLQNNRVLRQPSDFYPVSGVEFHVVLPMPAAYESGIYEIIVKDIAGNESVVTGQM